MPERKTTLRPRKPGEFGRAAGLAMSADAPMAVPVATFAEEFAIAELSRLATVSVAFAARVCAGLRPFVVDLTAGVVAFTTCTSRCEPYARATGAAGNADQPLTAAEPALRRVQPQSRGRPRTNTPGRALQRTTYVTCSSARILLSRNLPCRA